MDVAIIGAGPYGLSLAAYLQPTGVSCGIFGKPLETWLTRMPEGMLLKSDGFASNLCAPAGDATLAAYCSARGLPYHDTDIPVSLSTWNAYALDFQRRFVPGVDGRDVTHVGKTPEGFLLRLADGEEMRARFVVAAVGITHFAYMPPVFGGLPAAAVSHSGDHADMTRFAGRRLGVVGAGASAVDLAVLAAEAGAEVTVISRNEHIKFGSEPIPGPRPWHQRLRHPSSGMGPGLRSRIFQEFPHLFRFLPGAVRDLIVQRHLGPKSAYQMQQRFQAAVRPIVGTSIIGAHATDGGVTLRLRLGATGAERDAEFDHIIAATGFRVDIRRLAFLDPALRDEIRVYRQRPVLSGNFESSVAGLYFVGPPAVDSFGPLMRFMVGAEYAAPKLSRHLARRAGIPA